MWLENAHIHTRVTQHKIVISVPKDEMRRKSQKEGDKNKYLVFKNRND